MAKIQGLHSTGIGWPVNGKDGAWRLTRPDGTVGYGYVAADDEPYSTWDESRLADARWLTPDADAAAFVAVGDYIWEFDFYIHSDEDPMTASLIFEAQSDNESTVYLNGGYAAGPGLQFAVWSDWLTVSKRVGTPSVPGFVYGKNTLKFVTVNGGTEGNPAGLRVHFIDSYIAKRTRKAKFFTSTWRVPGAPSVVSSIMFGCNT
jgi:hypothetical protein